MRFASAPRPFMALLLAFSSLLATVALADS